MIMGVNAMIQTKKVMTIFTCLSLIAIFSLSCLYTKHDIHVTLDIRHIREQATNIEDYIMSDTDKKKEDSTDKSELITPKRSALSFLSVFSPFSTASAAEQESDDVLKNLSPEVKKAVEARKDRLDDIRKMKEKGLIGEGADGYVAIPEPAKKPAAGSDEAKKLDDLIKKENADRKTIYHGVAKKHKNGVEPTDKDIEKVQATWAEIHRENSEGGDWIEVPKGQIDYQKFLKSDIGKKLKEKPKPGSWAQIPK
jgi:uncharacterized protein YdbL (DUF1318 family)